MSVIPTLTFILFNLSLLAAQECSGGTFSGFYRGSCNNFNDLMARATFPSCQKCAQVQGNIAGSQLNCTVNGVKAPAFFKGKSNDCQAVFDKECKDESFFPFLSTACPDIKDVLSPPKTFDYAFCTRCNDAFQKMKDANLQCTTGGKDPIDVYAIDTQLDRCEEVFEKECDKDNYSKFLTDKCTLQDLSKDLDKDLCSSCGQVFYNLETSGLQCTIKGEDPARVFGPKGAECQELNPDLKIIQGQCTKENLELSLECPILPPTSISSSKCAPCVAKMEKLVKNKINCELNGKDAKTVLEEAVKQCQDISSVSALSTCVGIVITGLVSLHFL